MDAKQWNEHGGFVMKEFNVVGFSKDNVWKIIRIKTIKELVEQRAKENGLVKITFIEEAN